jgi:hypothetical protein
LVLEENSEKSSILEKHQAGGRVFPDLIFLERAFSDPPERLSIFENCRWQFFSCYEVSSDSVSFPVFEDLFFCQKAGHQNANLC